MLALSDNFRTSTYLSTTAVIAFFFLSNTLIAQTARFPLDQRTENRLTESVYTGTGRIHSAIRPYTVCDFRQGAAMDSLLIFDRSTADTFDSWFGRKLYKEHLLDYAGDDYRVYADFYPDFQIGRDVADGKLTTLNTRGIAVGGSLGDNLSFFSEFFENQAKFPTYLSKYVQSTSVVPGQGYEPYYGADNFDFVYSSAVVSYRLSDIFMIEGGQGKNFFGDGYRSFLLSDNSFNYPFFKLAAKVNNVKYVCLWAEFQSPFALVPNDEDPFPKKSGVFHYLDINFTDRLSIGFFEAIIWLPSDSAHSRGIEWNYLNPIIFLRPVEFSLGSPDNVLMGLNWHYVMSPNVILYGQVLIDELTVGEYVANNGYWGNKYAVQVGAKSFDAFQIHHLFLQTELNIASPYTFSHLNPLKNYSHYNQSLAHPLGANFYEGIGIAEYSSGRFEYRLQVNCALFGSDSSQTSSVGKDIFRSYVSRVHDYGNYIGQGIRTTLLYLDARLSYVLNPLNNLRFEAACSYRSLSSTIESSRSLLFSVGLRGSFRNIYYDF